MGDRRSEAFDREPFVITGGEDRFQHAVPIHMPGAWGAAVIFTSVDVLQMPGNRSKRGRYVLLFNVGVERIKQKTDTRMVDFIAQLDSIFCGVQREAFETI